MIRIVDCEKLLEMANVSKNDTKLPYDIWIDSFGKDRSVKHNVPRVKVNVDGEWIPISIEDNPKILVKRRNSFKGEKEIIEYIKKYLNVFISHWNKEITDREALNLLGEREIENK